jgi:hypothetical protein
MNRCCATGGATSRSAEIEAFIAGKQFYLHVAGKEPGEPFARLAEEQPEVLMRMLAGEVSAESALAVLAGE